MRVAVDFGSEGAANDLVAEADARYFLVYRVESVLDEVGESYDPRVVLKGCAVCRLFINMGFNSPYQLIPKARTVKDCRIRYAEKGNETYSFP